MKKENREEFDKPILRVIKASKAYKINKSKRSLLQSIINKIKIKESS